MAELVTGAGPPSKPLTRCMMDGEAPDEYEMGKEKSQPQSLTPSIALAMEMESRTLALQIAFFDLAFPCSMLCCTADID